MGRRYSKVELDWLRTAFLRHRLPALVERFNARFGAAVTQCQLKSILGNHDIRSGRPPGYARGERWVTWSPAMIAWLRQHRASGPIQEVTDRLNARFGTAFKKGSVANVCKKHGISAASDGRFRAGNVSWNKDRKGIPATGKQREHLFRRGSAPHTQLPMWSYRYVPKNGWLFKVSQTAVAGESRHDWRMVSRLTWEAAHGPIPAGHVVVYLDGDNHHCLDLTNLDCIPRAVLARLNQNGWGAERDLELRRFMLAQAKLYTAACATASRLGIGYYQRRKLMGQKEAA